MKSSSSLIITFKLGIGHISIILLYSFLVNSMSNYTPEDLKDVETKIAYLEDLKEIAKTCANGDEFKVKVSKKYPNYSGQNYLEMTTNFFFPANK